VRTLTFDRDLRLPNDTKNHKHHKMAEALETPPEWTILYHGKGKFKGRGEFLRLMLEDKCLKYEDTDDNLYGPKGMMDCFRGSAEAVGEEGAIQILSPIFFPPAIWHRPAGGEEVIINQVGACMTYLGEVLGYSPKTPALSLHVHSVSFSMRWITYLMDAKAFIQSKIP
jgi:hypothetical protein